MYYPRMPLNGCEVVLYDRHDPPLLLRQRSSQSFIVRTVAVSLFTSVFIYAMIVPLMPTVLVSRGDVLSADHQYWNSILFLSETMSVLVCSPMFGFLLTYSGTRQDLYLFGIVILFGSISLFAVADSIWWFVGSKVLQGAATSMTTVAGLEIVTDAVDKHQLGEMFGTMGTAMGMGLLLGPPIGGTVFKYGGFSAACGVLFGLITIDMGLRLFLVEKRVAARWITLPEYCPYNGHTYTSGYFSCETIGMRDPDRRFVAGNPLPFARLLQEPRILFSVWALIVSGLVLSSFDTTLSLFVQNRLEWDILGAGLAYIPLSSAALLQPLFLWLRNRLGNRTIAFASFCLLSSALVCLHVIDEATTYHTALLCILLSTVGVCVSSSEPALLHEIQQALDNMESKDCKMPCTDSASMQVFTLQTMARYGGLLLGPLQGGFVSFYCGWEAMTIGLGVLAMLTAAPMLLLSTERTDGSTDAERQPLLVA